MKYFDKIFVVSLPNEVGRKRMEGTGPHLLEQGIDYDLWGATEDENGVVGLVKSMHRLFTHCVEQELETVLVLEDDSIFKVSFWDFIREVWPQMPPHYHCLFLACTLISRPTRFSANLLRIGSSYCTNAIVYTLEAIKLILPMLERHPMQAYDITLMKELQPSGLCLATYPQMCFQRAGYSSIEKREIDWSEYQSQSFRMYTHNI